ncbi:MAG: MoaD family protein [Methanomassiliicoccales archaeon]|jgi:molybdopterin synthase sulfur carrier subunit
MTVVTLRTFGHIGTTIGATELKLDVAGDTVKSVLDKLVVDVGDKLTKILYLKGGQLSDLLYILVNGRNIRHLRGMQTKLEDGDVISLFPVTAGG